MSENLNREIPILMSGLPGKMASLVAEEIAGRGEFRILPLGLTSDRHNDETLSIKNNRVELRSAFNLEGYIYGLRSYAIAIDFTVPSACVANARLFSENGMPFVMGTSGGNREQMEYYVRQSRICAVIAPNMDPQIIGRQIEIDQLADVNPLIFSNAIVKITESHQKTKIDVSGTAKAFRDQFERYGAQPSTEVITITNYQQYLEWQNQQQEKPQVSGIIVSIRDTETQEALGIPNPDNGHAYHWVEVKSPNGELIYQFNTAVLGRTSYVEGSLMAAKFLSQQTSAWKIGKVFSMRDVLEGGE